MTHTIDEAFAAVRDGQGPHALTGTLAPVYDAVMDDAGSHYDDQAWLAEAELDGDERAVLEVGCGLGGLLARLEDGFETLVGIDPHPELLWFARDRTEAALAVGTPADLPVGSGGAPGDGGFGACLALGNVTAGLQGGEPERAFAEAFRVLAPGGRILVDAPTEPAAALADPWEGSRGRYRLRRSVVAGDVDGSTAGVALEYEITDTATGETVGATEHRELRLYDRQELSTLLAGAGFEAVEVTRKMGDENAILATATRPDE